MAKLKHSSKIKKVSVRNDPLFETILSSLASKKYTLRKPIPVLIIPEEDEFIASFSGANISTSGCSIEEAISNLRSLICDIFEMLDSKPKSKLGPSPKSQLLVLEEFLCRPSRRKKLGRSRVN